MNSLLQLSIALLLGMVAAGSNWLYLAAQTSPPAFVAVRVDVERESILEDDDLVGVPVPGDTVRLKHSLIPYENRSVLLGTRAARDFQRGDMIFARDLVVPVNEQQWDVIGPFELISVGERFKQGLGHDQDGATTMRGDSVTIAVDAGFDRNTSRLLEAIAADSRVPITNGKPQIVAVQVVPSVGGGRGPADRPARLGQGTDGGISATPQSGKVVYQTVSLEGIPNVPVVLLEGDLIRFVVPRRPGS